MTRLWRGGLRNYNSIPSCNKIFFLSPRCPKRLCSQPCVPLDGYHEPFTRSTATREWNWPLTSIYNKVNDERSCTFTSQMHSQYTQGQLYLISQTERNKIKSHHRFHEKHWRATSIRSVTVLPHYTDNGPHHIPHGHWCQSMNNSSLLFVNHSQSAIGSLH